MNLCKKIKINAKITNEICEVSFFEGIDELGSNDSIFLGCSNTRTIHHSECIQVDAHTKSNCPKRRLLDRLP